MMRKPASAMSGGLVVTQAGRDRDVEGIAQAVIRSLPIEAVPVIAALSTL